LVIGPFCALHVEEGSLKIVLSIDTLDSELGGEVVPAGLGHFVSVEMDSDGVG